MLKYIILSVYLSIYLSTYLPTYLSIYFVFEKRQSTIDLENSILTQSIERSFLIDPLTTINAIYRDSLIFITCLYVCQEQSNLIKIRAIGNKNEYK